jgi:hypothetical protein
MTIKKIFYLYHEQKPTLGFAIIKETQNQGGVRPLGFAMLRFALQGFQCFVFCFFLKKI